MLKRRAIRKTKRSQGESEGKHAMEKEKKRFEAANQKTKILLGLQREYEYIYTYP